MESKTKLYSIKCRVTDRGLETHKRNGETITIGSKTEKKNRTKILPVEF